VGEHSTIGPVDYTGWRRSLALIALYIDRTNDWIGRSISWLVPVMVLNTCIVAIFRYTFGIGWVWFQEIYIWTHGSIIMIAMGYTLLHGGHVRVDIIYERLNARTKAWINLAGVIFFLLPMIFLVLWVAYPYVALSIMRLEGSREAGGLPGLYVLKSTILMFCLGLGGQGFSLGCHSILELFPGYDHTLPGRNLVNDPHEGGDASWK
jgi:TRAP-type mannitol/chloroaromatic compound transport system permease small subunit